MAVDGARPRGRDLGYVRFGSVNGPIDLAAGMPACFGGLLFRGTASPRPPAPRSGSLTGARSPQIDMAVDGARHRGRDFGYVRFGSVNGPIDLAAGMPLFRGAFCFGGLRPPS
jgi:hypothetical protein